MLSAILFIVSIFFALNIGASGIAPSFASVYGAKFIDRSKAVLLFTVFAILGAISLGRNVALTLGGRLVSQEVITTPVAFVIIVSATFSLVIANLLKIPQSTSQVTVGALIGAGGMGEGAYSRNQDFHISIRLLLDLLRPADCSFHTQALAVRTISAPGL